jgi:excisionase family DNA binding protein
MMAEPTRSHCLVSARQAADYYGVCERTIRNWIADGRLATRGRDGRAHRIAIDDLDALGPRRRPRASQALRIVEAPPDRLGPPASEMLHGWRCPLCRDVYSPWVERCPQRHGDES